MVDKNADEIFDNVGPRVDNMDFDARVLEYTRQAMRTELNPILCRYLVLTDSESFEALSAIEKLLWVALNHNFHFDPILSKWPEFPALKIQTQQTIGDYRVDFLITWNQDQKLIADGWPEKTYRVVIEADGHDFHEKTKEQVRADKKRERDIVTAGYSILRFSGSEIWKDPDLCVHDIFKFMREQIKNDMPQKIRSERARLCKKVLEIGRTKAA